LLLLRFGIHLRGHCSRIAKLGVKCGERGKFTTVVSGPIEILSLRSNGLLHRMLDVNGFLGCNTIDRGFIDRSGSFETSSFAGDRRL